METADGSSSRLMSQRPGSSDGGRKADGGQRVRAAVSCWGMPRGSTGSSRGAPGSTHLRFVAAATCWAIRLFAAPGGSQKMVGWRASTRSASTWTDSLGGACSPRKSSREGVIGNQRVGEMGVARTPSKTVRACPSLPLASGSSSRWSTRVIVAPARLHAALAASGPPLGRVPVASA